MICIDALMTYPNRPFGHDKWCHLWDSEDDLDALHAFAAKLGLRRSWFQAHRTLPHYDLIENKQRQAIRLGAHLTTRQEMAAQVQARIQRSKGATDGEVDGRRVGQELPEGHPRDGGSPDPRRDDPAPAAATHARG